MHNQFTGMREPARYMSITAKKLKNLPRSFDLITTDVILAFALQKEHLGWRA
jgi:hypothetical protein